MAIGQFNVGYIIDVALPVLMFIYPLTIVLILLNVVSQKYASRLVFKGVVIITLLFSIPDFLQFFVPEGALEGIRSFIPLAAEGMGWVLPALIVFIATNLFAKSFQGRNDREMSSE